MAGKIQLLSDEVIGKIAAGEVVERPAAAIKELVENSLDAGASAVTVEIRDGGISYFRVTDNGSGIRSEDIRMAFERHATSKIRRTDDLFSIQTLGFRGEALASIAAVAHVTCTTRTKADQSGIKVQNNGGTIESIEEAACPEGTTFVVRDLFFNTPVRLKFLKKPVTEAGYVSDLMMRLILSRPDVSFRYISQGKTLYHSAGDGKLSSAVFSIYGREMLRSMHEVDGHQAGLILKGFVGVGESGRGSRNHQSFFINGRYMKSSILSAAVEAACRERVLSGKYPTCVLHLTMPYDTVDVNVHPTKMELRFDNNNEIYVELCDTIYAILSHKEMIPEVPVDSTPAPKKIVHEYKEPIPEPFEKRRINEVRAAESRSVYGQSVTATVKSSTVKGPAVNEPLTENTLNQQKAKTSASTPVVHTGNSVEPKPETSTAYEPAQVVTGTQQTLGDYDKVFLTESSKKQFSIIGQLFKTYWLIEFEDKLYIIDQHAAHEKVLYEKTMARLANKDFTSQRISPPIIMTLDARECEMLEKYRPQIEQFGYEVEHFGGKEYMISAIPDNLFNIDMKDLFIEMLDDFSNATGRQTPDIITEKVASMSCKAAVKGNDKLTLPEINKLIDELLSLDNPYNCPHGRPTIISMSKYEIEKKFKRIV